MTRGKAIEIMQINRDGVANMSWSEDRTKTLAAFDMAIKALEQEPRDDEITLKVKRGVLKSRQRGMVIYNVAWLREHWQMEMDIVCGVKPCEDAISRQAALDAFGLSEKTRKYGGDHSGYDTMMLYEIQQTLEDLPTVNPQEPKTGRWEWIQYDYNPQLGNWHCSECKCVVVECVGKNEKGGIPLYRYCPQCGAKIESEGT